MALQFDDRFNLIIGANAGGKTNLIEALFYFAYLSSFRQAARKDLLFNGSENALLQTEFIKNDCDYSISVGLQERGRRLRVNGKAPALNRDYYGLVNVLLFEPRDVYLFRETPSVRRHYADRGVFLINPSHIKPVLDYQKSVSQKNSLLKTDGRINDDLLDVWNQEMAQLGATILCERRVWLNRLEPVMQEEYQRLAGRGELLTLTYQSSLGDLPMAREDISKIFIEVLRRARPQEIRRREAFIGPHRDDWDVRLDGRLVGKRGSQGENRSLVIALKAAQIRLFEECYARRPVFLLDDVASELDHQRSQALFDYLDEKEGQVFLTTTEKETVSLNLFHRGRTFLVDDGKVKML